MPPQKTLQVIVRNRDGIMYSGPAASVTSKNSRGDFDVLPEHENFISLVDRSIVVKTPEGTEQEFPVTNGALKVVNDTVQVFLGIKKDEEASTPTAE